MEAPDELDWTYAHQGIGEAAAADVEHLMTVEEEEEEEELAEDAIVGARLQRLSA